MKQYHAVIFHLTLSVWGLTEGLIKEWRPRDTDWQNKLNWQGGRLPCPNSDVVLPEEVVVSIFVNGTVGWKSLVMPHTGELVLEDVTFSDVIAQPTCPPGEVRFINWRPDSWFDPDLWRLSTPDGTLVVEDGQPLLAVPHSERVPCVLDSVHLSDRHSLSVDFNHYESLTVGQVKYGEKYLTSEEWQSQLKGPEWSYQVHHPPRSVHVNGTECPDPAGCQCGNLHDTNVMQMVCSNAGSLCGNYPLECPNGIRPPGHCCDLCGSMIKMTVDQSIFSQTSLDRFVTSMIQNPGSHPLLGSLESSGGIQTYSYRTEVDALHLILADNTTNERSSRLARQIYDYLDKDRTNGNLYGIKALDLKQSGPSHPASHRLTPEELQLITTNLMTALGVFIVVALLAAAFYVYKKKRFVTLRGDELSFARFQNDPAAGNVEIGIEPGTFNPQSLETILDDPAAELEENKASVSIVRSSSRDVDSSPYAEEPVLPVDPAGAEGISKQGDSGPFSSLSQVTSAAAWKKLTRAFVNPLFGDPSAEHRLSGRWTMSSLLKTSATQENPIFDIRPASPPPSPPTSATPDPGSSITETASSSAITSTTTPPANSNAVVLSHPEATIESRHPPPPPAEIIIPAVNRNSDPPTVDTPDAPSSQIEIMESIGSDDIPLVDDEPEEADAAAVPMKMSQDMGASSSTITSPEEIPATKTATRMTSSSSAGSAVKKLWKKATTKSKSSSVPAPPPESIQPQDSSGTDDITALPTADDGPSSLPHHHAQRSAEEDTVQLTLAEETDD